MRELDFIIWRSLLMIKSDRTSIIIKNSNAQIVCSWALAQNTLVLKINIAFKTVLN